MKLTSVSVEAWSCVAWLDTSKAEKFRTKLH